MKKGRVLVLLVAGFVLAMVQGCGTATYDERYQERADDLRYSADDE